MKSGRGLARRESGVRQADRTLQMRLASQRFREKQKRTTEKWGMEVESMERILVNERDRGESLQRDNARLLDLVSQLEKEVVAMEVAARGRKATRGAGGGTPLENIAPPSLRANLLGDRVADAQDAFRDLQLSMDTVRVSPTGKSMHDLSTDRKPSVDEANPFLISNSIAVPQPPANARHVAALPAADAAFCGTHTGTESEARYAPVRAAESDPAGETPGWYEVSDEEAGMGTLWTRHSSELRSEAPMRAPGSATAVGGDLTFGQGLPSEAEIESFIVRTFRHKDERSIVHFMQEQLRDSPELTKTVTSLSRALGFSLDVNAAEARPMLEL